MEKVETYSPEYRQFVDYMKKNDLQVRPFTRTQYEFAEFLLKHKDIVGKIGDTQSVFSIVQRFIKEERP